MRVSIFGTGYVGLVTGACLADSGHSVVCMDVDAKKIEALLAGHIPIYEPGLEAIVSRALRMGTLSFTTDPDAAVSHATVQMIAVGTPPDESGAADLQYVLAVAKDIATRMTDDKIVVVKSTVPVGTSDQVRDAMTQVLTSRQAGHSVDLVSNPEFLKEGAAVGDFQKPDRIIVGAVSERARAVLQEVYEPFNRNHDRMLFMDVRSAELTKYAANAMLATKISFMNEIANLAERLGANIENVRQGIGSDPRIGYDFIYPGLGYGGSCFPKDVQALVRTAADVGYEAPLIEAVEAVNARQKTVLFDKIEAYFSDNGGLSGLTIAVWGLAFKPNTDDMREAPSRALIEALWDAGARVRAYDPVALDEMKRIYGERDDLDLVDTQYGCLDGADALAICTEWRQFRVPDFAEMKRRLNTPLIFDGRNIYAPDRLRHDGWSYVSIGRAPMISGERGKEAAS
ncbi:UDP-glucose dehydrogenase family protein [Cucumibacter marinus]|uniref:UDP-glucose dehydrogenase family protein n=1 Tax=Cucumibacter marinus TaxID=1121252 RepID=UPI000429D543|nr:UDP-glucose/GDP-mannose dehydrogenase family protein [Cucumibacter marinus]